MALRFWLVVQPLDRARELMAGGVVQAPWGAREGVAEMGESDGVALYSPREENPDGEPLRAFVGAGYITDAEPWQAGTAPTSPWRRTVKWTPDPRIAPIRPVRDILDLTRKNRWWGEQLRSGVVEISRRDFEVALDQVRRRAPEPGRIAPFLIGQRGAVITERGPSPLRDTGWSAADAGIGPVEWEV